MATKKMLDKATRQLLDEVSGKAKPLRETNHSKTGESAAVKVVRPVKVKKITPAARHNFVKLAKARIHGKVKLEQLKEEVKQAEITLAKMTVAYGRPLVTDPRDKVLFVAPYKAHLIWNTRAGTIDTEAVAKAFPELIDGAVETINMSFLQTILEKYDIPKETKDLIANFKKAVEGLEKATDVQLIERKDDQLLNMEKYHEYKQNGKIAPEQVASFEAMEGHHSFRVEKLSEGPKCSACGFRLPKRQVKGQKHTCTRCGHTE